MDIATFGLVPHSTDSVEIGQVFGRFTVLAVGKLPGTYNYMAVCQCSCGTPPYAVRIQCLKDGRVQSCGCLQKEATTKHGKWNHRLYPKWSGMKRRCTNPKDTRYADYGGRGIRVCDRWMDLLNFIADMDPTYQEGLELDRIDNDGNYEPSNCRWTSHAEQAANKRTIIRLTHNGKTQSLAAWSRETGMSYGTLWERVKVLEWDAERTISTPVLDVSICTKRARTARWGK